MSSPGGGPDIADILRQFGKEAVLREAENAGLKPRAGRMRCPFAGCRDKPEGDRKDSVQLYPGKRGEWRLKCHRCATSGSLIDLLAAVHGWTDAQAIAHLRGLPAPAPKAPLRLVQPEQPVAPDKLTPEQIRPIWDGLALDDVHGRAYLEGRGLGDAIELGLARFAHPKHSNPKVVEWYRRQRLLVCLLKDVVGNARGLQARLVREVTGKEPKISSLKGSVTKRAFFGNPELIESSAVIAVAEGLADTLGLAGWARDHEVVVVGAAGKDALPELARELEQRDIPVEGRIFVLFPQNDRPKNDSRRSFDQLGQLLNRAGARVVMSSTNEEYKDLAEWLQATPDAHWPPPALARVLGGEVDHETPATKMVEPARGGLPIQERIEVAANGQNFSTLVSLLDNPLNRESIMGRRGELAFNEMSGELDFCGAELDESDITGIRLGLEKEKSVDGKLLKFSPEDIWAAIVYLSKRKKIHPIRDWLKSLKWDGVQRLDERMPTAFGHEAPSLEAHLLRKWFISAAARGIEPGCKVDTVLVLIGDEGLKKSTLFKMLAGGKEFFTSSPVKIGEPDGFSLLRRKWIVEWPELDSMKRARDQDAIKAFLSNTDDDYRAKWGRGQISVARSCVMVATTNEERFLQGELNRRFWNVRVTQLDFDWLKQNREQLWAEAAYLFLAAFECPVCKPMLPDDRCDEHKWWLEKEFEPALRVHNLQHQEVDEWVNVIREWIAEHSPKAVQVHQILEKAIGKPPGQWGPRDPSRATEALKKLGWRKGGRRFEGQVGSFWVPPQYQADFELGDQGGSADGG